MNPNKKKISQAKARLYRADAPISNVFAASCSLASIIFACHLMIGVIEALEARIEELEKEKGNA